MKITTKAYECTKCGKEEEHETNHWGSIYNIYCSVCSTLRTWKVSEEIPEDAWIPEPWTEVKVETSTLTLNKHNWKFFKIALGDAEQKSLLAFEYGGMRFETAYAKAMVNALDKKISEGWTQQLIQPKEVT